MPSFDNITYIKQLPKSLTDPDFILKYNSHYLSASKTYGISSPLSASVLYDLYIHNFHLHIYNCILYLFPQFRVELNFRSVLYIILDFFVENPL